MVNFNERYSCVGDDFTIRLGIDTRIIINIIYDVDGNVFTKSYCSCVSLSSVLNHTRILPSRRLKIPNR